MKKRGQFYLVAVIMVAGIFISLLTIQNQSVKQDNVFLDELENEISIEKRYLLDHIAFNDLSDENATALFENFSDNYIQKSEFKDVIFLIGNSTNVLLKGIVLENFVFSYSNGTITNDLGEGNIDIYTDSSTTMSIIIDGFSYDFEFSNMQNIYYIIRHNYNKEVHIIRG